VLIKIERSGGLAGIPISNIMDVNELPSKLMSIAKKIMEDKKSFSLPKSYPKGAADHYTYKISIEDGANRRFVECTQYDTTDDLKSLIKYIERGSKTRKSTGKC
jgi:Emfourin